MKRDLAKPGRKISWRLIGGSAVLAVVAAAAALGSILDSPAKRIEAVPPTVPVAPVTKQDLSKSIEVTAEFRPYQEVDVHAKVAGYLQSIGVDIGDQVKEGQVIAQLEVPELKEDLAKAAAATEASKHQVNQADVVYQEAHLAFTRLSDVAKSQPNLIAQQDLDVAEGHDQEAAAALASAQSQVEETQANLAKMVTMLGYTMIKAPFDGVVTHRFSDTGALVQAGTASETQSLPVVSLDQENLLRLVFPVPESSASLVTVGQAVEITVSALHQTFEGKVSRYNGRLDTSTRTMETEVDVPNADLRYKPGMYASVHLVLDQAKDVLSIPVQALGANDRNAVEVVGPDHRIESRVVKLGIETPYRVEVVDGLAENELVLVGGAAGLKPGEEVVGKVVETGSPQAQ